MSVYVGSLFKCTGPVADIMADERDGEGIREGQVVAWLTADSPAELRMFADKLGLPSVRRLGLGAMMRYVITGFERNQAMAAGAQVRVFAAVRAR